MFVTTCMNLDCKESACNAGHPVSIPRLQRSPEERNGNPLQCFWGDFPSDFAGKESACMQDTQGLEDPLEGEMATHSSILAWRISWTEATVCRVTQIWA